MIFCTRIYKLKHRIFIRQLYQWPKYSVLPGPAIYPVAGLDGFSRFVLAPNGARR